MKNHWSQIKIKNHCTWYRLWFQIVNWNRVILNRTQN